MNRRLRTLQNIVDVNTTNARCLDTSAVSAGVSAGWMRAMCASRANQSFLAFLRVNVLITDCVNRKK